MPGGQIEGDREYNQRLFTRVQLARIAPKNGKVMDVWKVREFGGGRNGDVLSMREVRNDDGCFL